jgi:hypothetical protein
MLTQSLILDDRTSNTLLANNRCVWRAVSDSVMGGVSHAALTPAQVEGKNCLHLSGVVSLERNGGFLQASIDLSTNGILDASNYLGISFEVYGNNEIYNLHLRTSDTTLVWQSYRASFFAPSNWEKISIPFEEFAPHRLHSPLNIRQLKRLGIVAIGRPMSANLYFRNVVFLNKKLT